MKGKRINAEIKWGAGILSLYLLWVISWVIYSRFIVGSWMSPYSPDQDLERELFAPLSPGLLLGSDVYGRSLAEILSQGLLYSLTISLTVSFLSCSLGIVIGHLSANGPTFIRKLTDLVTNLVFIFPSILIAIMVMAMTGQSHWGLVGALVITGWPGYARIARGEGLRIRNLAFVESARAIGVGDLRLFFTVFIPELMPILSVHFVLGISGVIMSESALGFLGLGASEYSWGAMLSMAKTVLLEAPFLVVWLSVALAGLIIGLNLLGDGLRDYFDPKEYR
jgi:peptide/nickel transport system permease protein